MDRDVQKTLKRATLFAHLLDNQFNFFGIKFGLTLLLDLIPEVGDIIAFILSFYFIYLAISLKAPKILIARMLFNIGINLLLGLIPIVGEVTYIFRKANIYNIALLKEYIKEQV